MRLLSCLTVIALLVVDVPVIGDVTIYGVRFPSKGPRSSGVVNVDLPNFPWRSTKRVRTVQGLERLIHPSIQPKNAPPRPPKPAIFYLSKHEVSAKTSNLAKNDVHYFLQQDVKARLHDYRWYWTSLNSIASRLLEMKYNLKGSTALVIFESDGSVLHVETPISGPASVTRAMRMIEYKHRMTATLKADLPHLRSEFKDGNFKALVRYLQHADKHRMYASEWTEEKLSAMRRAMNHKGDERIRQAEALALAGERQKALKALQTLKRHFHPLKVAQRADVVAKKIRRSGS